MIDRYTLPEMGKTWTEENKYRKWLDVEVALVKAHAKLGTVPADIVADVEKKGNTKTVKLERVQAIEAEINHARSAQQAASAIRRVLR